MREDQTVLYMHAGSKNHGCEAIVNGLCTLLDKPPLLLSTRAQEDECYSLRGRCQQILQERNLEQNPAAHVFYYARRKLFGDSEGGMRYRYRDVCGKNARLLNISIGGDNYCYENMIDRLLTANRMFHRQGGRTVLYGCSIEPALLKRAEILEDMKRYDLIAARESITYQALLNAGADQNTVLCPDPAFLMEKEELPLPDGWVEGRMLGVNVSPMIVDNETRTGITMENYKELIAHVLRDTDLCVALIPHVVWENNDDRKPLEELYGTFAQTGRVVRIPDASAPQLKGYISRCRMFVGARTHATIAAYSSCVPTLVVGYSVKARGIARDLFGTQEHYVLPVQRLGQAQELADAFDWLADRETATRDLLRRKMPAYLDSAAAGAEWIERVRKTG